MEFRSRRDRRRAYPHWCATGLGQIWPLAPHPLGYTEQWSFDLEYQINANSAFQIGYSGKQTLEVMPDALLQPLLSSLSVMSLELRAALRAAQGKAPDAKTPFQQTAQEEERLGYREPPGYIRPVEEAEGAAMMAIGNWEDTKAAYQRALAERPRSGFALYGMAMASEKSGDSAVASKEYADFLAAWKEADAELPQLKHAQSSLAQHALPR